MFKLEVWFMMEDKL